MRSVLFAHLYPAIVKRVAIATNAIVFSGFPNNCGKPRSMKQFFELLTLCLLLICSVSICHAAKLEGIKFDRLSWEKGISQSQINCIIQDSKGFLWIGTNNGLNRYDGYEFREFNHDPKDSNTLSNNRVWALHEDHNGGIWIATWGGGVNYFDRATETFHSYKHDPDSPTSIGSDDVRSICQDSQGQLWFGTWGGGLNRFDSAASGFVRYLHDPADSSTIGSDKVWALLNDEAGGMWIATSGGGLNHFDTDRDTFVRHTHNPNNIRSLASNDVSAVFRDNDSTLWVGTWGGGLHSFDLATGQFLRYRHNSANVYSLSSNYIRCIERGDEGVLWVGTWGGGISLFIKNKRSFRRYQRNASIPTSLSDNNVSAIYRDRTGISWVGTWGGLNVYDPLKQKFDHYRVEGTRQIGVNRNEVHAIFQSKRGGPLWVGTWGGLNKYVNDDGEWVYRGTVSSENSNLSASDTDVRAIIEDRDGTIWVGTVGGGLCRFNPITNNFKQYKHEPNDSTSLSNNDVRCIVESADGNLWVGTSGGGLNHFDRKNSKFTTFRHDETDEQSLNNDFISALSLDAGGNLWVGTLDGGLNKFDPSSAKFLHFVHETDRLTSLSSNSISYLFLDQLGALWVSTDRGGLNKLTNPAEVQNSAADFVRFTVSDGLVNNRVYAMCADPEGMLWISADQGISRLNPTNASFRNFDINDGLQAYEFNEGAVFVSKKGEVFFGGPNGFNAFYSSAISDNPYKPPVVINDLKVFGERWLSTSALEKDEEIVLSYEQNFFSFEFVALNYTNSAKNQYAYKLEGVDNDWVQAGTRRFTNYTNIDGGEYIFRVKASNNDGLWNDEGTSVRVKIIPPFWQETWFGIVALICILALIMLAYTLRVRIIRRQNIKLEREVAKQTEEIRDQNEHLEQANTEIQAQRDNLKEVNHRLESALDNLNRTQDQLVHSEKMASLGELTAGIAHEIQNPLNFVNNFSEVSIELCNELEDELSDDKDSAGSQNSQQTLEVVADLKENMARIHEHGNRATRIVSGMLEHTRSVASERTQVDLHSLLNESINLAYHGIRARDSSFNARFIREFDDAVTTINVASQDLSRVLINLINNGCYAADLKRQSTNKDEDFLPEITIATKDLGDKVELRIKDNGIGIPEDQMDKIFNPFFTTKPAGEGTGLGLSISYDIITKGHGGSISVASALGQYTEFIIVLPKS